MIAFFAIDIEHEAQSISKCLINLNCIVQVVFNDKIGVITTNTNHKYNLGRPDIDRLLKVMKANNLITNIDLSIIYDNEN